jgi:hypothetical protein
MSDLSGRLFGARAIDIHNCDDSARLRRPARNRLSDACSRPGDYGGLSG